MNKRIISSFKPATLPEIVDRFWTRVDRSAGAEGCWPWVAGKSGCGYGTLGVNWTDQYVHRLSYEMNFGPIPDGMCVCHHCDNPPCVNPLHLFLGTVGDNVRDMVQKGRWRRPIPRRESGNIA